LALVRDEEFLRADFADAADPLRDRPLDLDRRVPACGFVLAIRFSS
jgi:hypothetical protein